MKPSQPNSSRLAGLALAVLVLLLVTSQAVASTTSSFEGKWTAIDTSDSSRMMLWIRADKDIASLHNIRYSDQSCGGCAGLPGTGRFIGFLVEDDYIHGVGYFRSQGHTYFYQLEGDWYHDPGTDTISEYLAGGWNTWHRSADD